MQWVPVGVGSSPSSPSSSSKRGRAWRPRPLNEDRPNPVSADQRRSLNDDRHGEYTTFAFFSPDELRRHRRLVQSAPASPTREGQSFVAAQSASSSPHCDAATRGAWPLTPSSCDRTPSPCMAPPTAFIPMMVPIYAVPPMPLNAPVDAGPPLQWADEVSGIVARLRALAHVAPPPPDGCFVDRETATLVDMVELERWEAAADNSRRLQAKVMELEQQAAAEQAATSRIENEFAAMEAEVQSLTNQLTDKERCREAGRLEEHLAAEVALSAATERAENSVQALASAKRNTKRRANASSEFVSKLRAQLAAQVEATRDAEQKVARAKEAQTLAQELPRLRSRQKAAESRAAQLVKDCDSAQHQLEALQAEEASLQTGNCTRIDLLQARATQLEEECRNLQQNGGVAQMPGSTGNGSLADLQESNQRLLAEVREARAEHDEAHATLAGMETDAKNLKTRSDNCDSILEDIRLQVYEDKCKHIEWKDEVKTLRAQLTNVEQTAKDFEEENQAYKRKHQEAKDAHRSVKEHVLRLEKTSLELDGKLQNFLTKLEKEKPEEPLSRCLRYSRPREKWSNACRLRPRDRLGGSDAGSESIDADVSTTCGESAVDMDLGQTGV